MKVLKIPLFLLLLLLLAGCIGEDTDDCPETRYRLYFSYPAFSERISCVNVGVFDSCGVCVESFCVEKEALASFQGADLSLPAGNYTAVCWGNALDNTELYGLSVGCSPDEVEVCHPNLGTGRPIQTNDPLYYGKQPLTIDYSSALTDTIYFRPAHIGLEVYVRGLSADQLTEPFTHPLVAIDNTRAAFGADMQCLGKFTDYYPSVACDGTHNSAYASLNVLRFTTSDDLRLVLNDTRTGAKRYSLSLSSFILRNGIEIREDNEVLIPIYIDIINKAIQITVKPWTDIPVKQ